MENIFVILFSILVVVVVPIKIGAHLVNAQRTGLLFCSIAAAIGIFASIIVSKFLGGIIGGSLAGFIGFTIAIHYILITTIKRAAILSIIAIGISILFSAILNNIL